MPPACAVFPALHSGTPALTNAGKIGSATIPSARFGVAVDREGRYVRLPSRVAGQRFLTGGAPWCSDVATGNTDNIVTTCRGVKVTTIGRAVITWQPV